MISNRETVREMYHPETMENLDIMVGSIHLELATWNVIGRIH